MPIDYFVFTSPENITTVSGIVNYANSMTGYLIGPAVLFLVFMIALITQLTMPNSRTEESIVSSLWLVAILGMFLALIPNMLDGTIVLGLFIVAGLSTVPLWKNS